MPSPADIQALWQRKIQLARQNSAAFCSFVLTDGSAHLLKEQAPMHFEWHRLAMTQRRLIIEGSAECGKTIQLAVGYAAWRIGRDPGIQIAISSKGEDLATKIVNGIWATITNPRFKLVFPGIEPGRHNTQMITVRGCDPLHPTVQVVAFFRGTVTGKRIKLLISDDILDDDNTKTEEQRVWTYDRYYNVFVNRMLEGGQELWFSNAWHPRDALHMLKAEASWTHRRYPIWRPATLDEIENPLSGAQWIEGNSISSIVGPAGRHMISQWPAQWSMKRIIQKMNDMAARPVFFARSYECVSVDDASQTWNPAWIEKAEQRGKGLDFCRHVTEAHGEQFRYIACGVDLATKRPASRRKTDDSVFTVAGMYANGDRRLLYIESGKFSGPDIIRKIENIYLRYGCIFWVESNGCQQYIVDFTKESQYAIPVMSFETHGNKADPSFGIESLMTEQHQGRWLYPWYPGQAENIEYQKLKQAMLGYHPAGHTPDHLMSKWICREGLRLGPMNGESWNGNPRRR